MTATTASTGSAAHRSAHVLRYTLVGLCLFLLSGALYAERQVEVIDLVHSDADTIIGLIQPHVSPDVTLSGAGAQLLVRGDTPNRDAVRALVRELDRPSQPIRISVRTEAPRTRIETGEGRDRAGHTSRVYSTRDRRGGDQSYSVRANANQPAYIGRSVRLPVQERDIATGRDGIHYRDRTSFIEASEGFFATARLHGDTVTVELAVASGLPVDTDRVSSQREVITQVTGGLGQWIPIGEIDDRRVDERRGTTYRTRDRDDQGGTIWLRVDSLNTNSAR